MRQSLIESLGQHAISADQAGMLQKTASMSMKTTTKQLSVFSSAALID